MKMYYIIPLLIILTSCNNSKKCSRDDYKLDNYITIEGWKKSDLPITKAKLYFYNDDDSIKQDSIETKFILSHLDIENPDPSETNIIFEKELNTKHNYKLILNNKDVYYINNFNVITEEKYSAVTKMNFCSLVSFEVNGKKQSKYGAYGRILFDK
ncbi:hypothetical protein [Flavobacterium oreochromis]|uniref:Lipoprotein n=2 Tax=Flavobacterium TaxID=237 RepID=A0A246G7D4_9FLAO|nr:hypothetical protein [Flavobacterium oreochromis]OWP74359.1 hypothetical protein BWK62_14520 [Flavobacterium oreochromis]